MEPIGHVIRIDDDKGRMSWLDGTAGELAEGPRKEKENCSLLEKVGERSWFLSHQHGSLVQRQKRMVKERVKHIEEWEMKGGHKATGERGSFAWRPPPCAPPSSNLSSCASCSGN